jgi:hypothetical protein
MEARKPRPSAVLNAAIDFENPTDRARDDITGYLNSFNVFRACFSEEVIRLDVELTVTPKRSRSPSPTGEI